MGKPKASSAPAKAVPATPAPDAATKPAKPPNKRMLRMGATVTAKQPHVTADGIVVKEWQRLPKQLLQEYCQAQKLNKPIYARSHIHTNHERQHDADTAEQSAPSNGAGGAHRIRCIIPDKKGVKANDINVVSNETFNTVSEAEHMSALLMLHTLTPTIPYDRKLPAPYDLAWKSLSTASPSVTSNSKYTTQADKQQQIEQSRAKQNRIEASQLHRDKQYHIVQMSESNQTYVENIVKALQALEHSAQHSNGTTPTEPVSVHNTELIQQLTSSGFHVLDVESAIAALRRRAAGPIDSDTCVEYLLLYTPESRLPAKYKQQKKTDFTVVSNSVDNVGSLLSVLRQCVPHQIINKYSKQYSNVYDICTLLYRDIYTAPTIPNGDSAVETTERRVIIDEELSALQSIYDTAYSRLATDTTVTQWSIEQKEFQVTFVVSSVNMYPHELPVIIVGSAAHQLSASQSLYILNAVQQHLTTKQLIGHTVSYDVVQYLIDEWGTLLTESRDAAISLPVRWQKYVRSVTLNEQQLQQLQHSHLQQTTTNNGTTKSKSYNRKSSAAAKIVQKLYTEYQSKQQNSAYKQMLQQRAQLPVYSKRDELLQSIERSQLVIVSAATGSGKSTQIPQLILEACVSKQQPVNVICTQPRRISAIGLAARVSDERCETTGHSVGYRVRLDNKVSEYTCLTYVTVGILLQQLVNSTSELQGITHIVIDEIHERSVDIDIVLLLIKNILQTNRTIKFVLMSATLTAGLYAQYFKSVVHGEIPMLSIAGRMFDVEEIYLEDVFSTLQYQLKQRQCVSLSADELESRMAAARQYYYDRRLSYTDQVLKQLCIYNNEQLNLELIQQLIMHLIQNEISHLPAASRRKHGILVFLPGVAEINRLKYAVEGDLQNTEYIDQYTVIALHSQLSNQQQSLVFKHTNATTIVLSTNIAETSITVNDIVYVIDTGKVKQTQYNSITDISTLTEQFITQSNATQRKGRAGRVQAGTVYRLYSRQLFDTFDTEPVPEIQRINLQHICLQLTQFTEHSAFSKQQVSELLGGTLNPPAVQAITHAINSLKELGALGQQNDLTALGRNLTALPINDVKIGKLLLYGSMLQCVTPALCIAAILSANKSLLTATHGEAIATTQVPHNKSDYLYQYNWYKLWYQRRYGPGGTPAQGRQFASANGLSDQTCDMVQATVEQYVKALIAIQFLPNDFRVSLLEISGGTSYDNNQGNVPMITGVLCAALYPNVIKVKLPQAKYQSTAHGSVAVDADAKSIRYFVQHVPDAMTASTDSSKTAAPANAIEQQHNDQRVFIHPKSVNFNTTDYECPYLLYNRIQGNDSGRISIFDCSVATAYGYLLLSNSVLSIDHSSNLLILDSYIKFKCNNTRVSILIKQLRHYLNVLFQNKIANPSLIMNGKVNPVLDAIQRLISTNGY